MYMYDLNKTTPTTTSTHLVNKHSWTLVVHTLVDAVPTVDVCIRGLTTIGAVAFL